MIIENLKKNFCGNSGSGVKMKRELVKGRDQVFSLENNAAIQTGVQRFYIITEGQVDKLVEESKFSRQWQKKARSRRAVVAER